MFKCLLSVKTYIHTTFGDRPHIFYDVDVLLLVYLELMV